MPRTVIAIGLMIAIGAHALPLAAQRPVSVGVAAGVAMPFGTLRDETTPGVRALATLDLALPEMPVSMRIDGAYDRLGFKPAPTGAAGRETGARTITSGSISLTLGSLTTPERVSPYAIAGVGMHHVGCAGRSDCDAVDQMGWNAGAGVRLGLFGLRGFIEARLHRLAGAVSDLDYVPVTVGVFF